VETTMLVATTIDDKYYYKNMFIKLSDEYMKKTLVYDEYKQGTMAFSNLNVDSVIKNITAEETSEISRDYLSIIAIQLMQVPHTTKSLQVWFFNEQSKTFYFVFGVNLYEEDFIHGYIKIYLSSLSKKDTRVYNYNNVITGKVKNFASDEREYGTKQQYEIIPNN
jgi:hypothetical protein